MSCARGSCKKTGNLSSFSKSVEHCMAALTAASTVQRSSDRAVPAPTVSCRPLLKCGQVPSASLNSIVPVRCSWRSPAIEQASSDGQTHKPQDDNRVPSQALLTGELYGREGGGVDGHSGGLVCC